jgi:hypothetical protein
MIDKTVGPVGVLQHASNTSAREDLRVTMDNFAAPLRFLFRNSARAVGSLLEAIRGHHSAKAKHV